MVIEANIYRGLQFIHSTVYLLSLKRVPSTVPGTVNSGANKTDGISVLMQCTFPCEATDNAKWRTGWTDFSLDSMKSPLTF